MGLGRRVSDSLRVLELSCRAQVVFALSRGFARGLRVRSLVRDGGVAAGAFPQVVRLRRNRRAPRWNGAVRCDRRSSAGLEFLGLGQLIVQLSASAARTAGTTAFWFKTGSEPEQAEASRADVGVRRGSEIGGAAAEQVALGEELGVHLEADELVRSRSFSARFSSDFREDHQGAGRVSWDERDPCWPCSTILAQTPGARLAQELLSPPRGNANRKAQLTKAGEFQTRRAATVATNSSPPRGARRARRGGVPSRAGRRACGRLSGAKPSRHPREEVSTTCARRLERTSQVVGTSTTSRPGSPWPASMPAVWLRLNQAKNKVAGLLGGGGPCRTGRLYDDTTPDAAWVACRKRSAVMRAGLLPLPDGLGKIVGSAPCASRRSPRGALFLRARAASSEKPSISCREQRRRRSPTSRSTSAASPRVSFASSALTAIWPDSGEHRLR